ncbi:MAG TPA: PAS domain S-box protein [Candidatus Acidoferrum sp.]
MFVNQGPLAIAFFEVTALIVLLVLFLLLRRDHADGYLRLWLVGWIGLTLSSVFELGLILDESPELRLAALATRVIALLLFLSSVMQLTIGGAKRNWPVLPLATAILAGVYYVERSTSAPYFGKVHWETAALQSVICLWAGWLLWRARAKHKGHGGRLLAGALLVSGLHNIDRYQWLSHPLFLLRLAFDHLLSVSIGIAMAVLVLESARARSDELNDKMRRLSLLTAASTQTLSVREVLEQVLGHVVESLGATHGIVRLLEGDGSTAQLVARASVGFQQAYLQKHERVAVSEPWVQRVLQKDCLFLRLDEGVDAKERTRMEESGVSESISLALPGKNGPVGIISVGSFQNVRFQRDEISYLVNIANLLGLTLQNVRLFEQVATVQQQWAYTFDSIGDPIFVHDPEFRILRTNQRLGNLLGRDAGGLIGRMVTDLLPRKGTNYKSCPYCEGVAGEGDDPDPWLTGYFLASNSTFTDPSGRQLGTVHALKDISERKRAEEKYRTLVSNVQEGVFISNPQGRFLDFNDALMRILGFEERNELLNAEIPAMFVNPADRERLKKLLQDHGAVADFEYEIRRKDGEVRAMLESSIAIRDAAGNLTALQGFLLDITDRKRAEQEIRRRNRELMVLNSIGQTLTESLDLTDSIHRTLRQMTELFSLDASSLYLLDEGGLMLRRIAAVGHRSEQARHIPPVAIQPELLQHIKAVHATFLSAQGLPLPLVLREAQRKEGLHSAFVVILWSKDRVLGGLVVGSRTPREFSPADINLLIAVGSQISNAIDRSVLYEETRQAYENLRRTQEQLLHSEKMAAVGQLISGVAHELNNPLTAILGYSQLLLSSGQMPPQGMEYSDKLYKQAQRTHRIVQNLLSFARQHKPERVAVQLNQILEDTLALRDYDLRLSNIRVHYDLASDLPMTAADPHQLQQVFLNLVNNAVDAILEQSNDGDLWVSTKAQNERLIVEFKDSGPGVKDASRVFDPFYTTKPVGKGTGLGLSICYGIVSEHGGSIRVSNLQPSGACFTIELPYQRAAAPEDTVPDGGVVGARGGRILLIDHDVSVLEAVEAILHEGNHAVRAAASFPEAERLLGEQEFDAVVADAEVRVGAGAETLQDWLKVNRPALARRLVWMRASAMPAPEENHTGNGIYVLQKPFKAADLLSAVEMALGHVQTAPIQG